jgi:mevalonate kinase
MPAISKSAPGKVILLGEHAVVYGQPAIAVPLNKLIAKAFVGARPDKPSGWVDLQAPDIGLESTLMDMPTKNPLALAVRLVLAELGISQPPAMYVRISSTIPVASGLGSGASVTVAIIRAVSEFLGKPIPDERVSALTYEVEKLHHGMPSGIDNTVITYSKPIYFRRTNHEGVNHVETFKVASPFTIVIGDTGIPSSTSIAVGDVRNSWQEEPQRFDSLFERVGEIVKNARTAIEEGEIESLGLMMDENQELLDEMGVSSRELDHLIQVARSTGAQGAKLSGGGRGGNMIALVASDIAEKVSQELSKAGATNTIVTEIRN